MSTMLKSPQPLLGRALSSQAVSAPAPSLITPLDADNSIPKRHFYVHSGNFKGVALSALQNILFLLRIASKMPL